MTGKKHQTHTRGRKEPKSGKKGASPQASHPRRGAQAAPAPGKGVVATKGSPSPKTPLALDTVALKHELQELAGKDLKVKLHTDPQGKCAAGIRHTDRGFDIYLNPERIRSEEKLADHINWVRSQVA